MSPAAAAEPASMEPSSTPADEHSSDMENNTLQGQETASKHSYDSDKEDAATQAASENLKHTTISDKDPEEDTDVSGMIETDPPTQEERDGESPKRMTPEPKEPSDAQDEEMKERVSSPKKKRVREQDDEARDLEAAGSSEESGITSNGSAINGGRTTSSAPVKKRHRDTSVDTISVAEGGSDAKDIALLDSSETITTATAHPKASTTSQDTSVKSVFGSNLKNQPQTSPTAFASSGFGSLAVSNNSGFAALAGKPSVFGTGSKSQVSGFGALSSAASGTSDTAAVKSGFGSIVTETPDNTSSSGFGSTATSGFGALGGGFGGGFRGFAAGTGPKLSSFAASGTPTIAGVEKPAKAFGAPESDEEEESDDDEGEGGAASDEDEVVSVEEKKKQKFTRVPVNDGEEGEATVLQFRAKLYTLESKEKGWKERGVGTLKLNVNRTYIDYHENGTPILGSFDPSGRDDDEGDGSASAPTAARLIMRQENTHRVILNTVILKALKFEEKPSNSAIQILFTAFEDTKPVNMLLKMSEANAKLFTSEITSIQHEL